MADLSNLDISTLIDRIDMLLDSLKSYDDLNDNEVALMIQSEQIKDWLWIERDVAFARSLAEPNESQEGRSDEFSQRFMSEIHGGSSTTYSPEAIRSTFGKYFGGTPYIRPIFQRPLDSCTSAPRGPGTSHEPISSPNSPTRRRGPLAHPLGSSISAGLILADSSSSKVSNINPSQPRSYTSVSTAAVGLPAPNEASSRPRPRVSHPSTLEDIRMRSWVDLPAPGEPSSSKAAGKRPETNLLSNANIQNAKRIPITITPMRAISASEAPYTFGRPSSATTRSSNNSVAVPELRSSAVERSVASIGVSASADIVTSTPILFGPMASSSARTPIPVIASSSRASISESRSEIPHPSVVTRSMSAKSSSSKAAEKLPEAARPEAHIPEGCPSASFLPAPVVEGEKDTIQPISFTKKGNLPIALTDSVRQGTASDVVKWLGLSLSKNEALIRDNSSDSIARDQQSSHSPPTISSPPLRHPNIFGPYAHASSQQPSLELHATPMRVPSPAPSLTFYAGTSSRIPSPARSSSPELCDKWKRNPSPAPSLDFYATPVRTPSPAPSFQIYAASSQPHGSPEYRTFAPETRVDSPRTITPPVELEVYAAPDPSVEIYAAPGPSRMGPKRDIQILSPSETDDRSQDDDDSLPPSPLSGSDASSIVEALLEERRNAPRNDLLQCSICFEETPPEESFESPCSHIYCADCVERFVENFTRDETLFPFRCCQEPITTQDVVPFISDSLRKLFNEKIAEYSVAIRFRLYCHSQACSAFLGSYPPIVIRRNSITSVECSECHLRTCPKCKQVAHPEEPDCRENEAAVELRRLARGMGWQKCSSCKWLVERSAGCNHLVCRCGFQFCYACAKPWDTIHDCSPNLDYT